MLSPDRLTVKSADALNDALALARRNGNPLVYDAHLLAALLEQDESIVVPALQTLGVSVPTLRETLELTAVLDRAEQHAQARGDECVSTEQRLSAVSDAKGTESKTALAAEGV